DVEQRARMWSSALSRPAPARLVVTESLTAFCFYGPSRDDAGQARIQAEIYALYVHPDRWRPGAVRARGAGRARARMRQHRALGVEGKRRCAALLRARGLRARRRRAREHPAHRISAPRDAISKGPCMKALLVF